MKTESNLQPGAAFEINELPNGTAEVLFYENVEKIPDNELQKFTYDLYSITTPNRENLSSDIEGNYEQWIEFAKASETIAPEPQTPNDQEERIFALETENFELKNIINTMLGGLIQVENQEQKLYKAQQFARAVQLTAEKMELSESEAMEIADLFEPWEPGKKYPVGKKLKYGTNKDAETQLYIVLQEHTSQADWTPDKSASLFKVIGFTSAGVPIWTQPIGAVDAYQKGDIVSHKEKQWVSDNNANVWEPGVYGWTVKK